MAEEEQADRGFGGSSTLPPNVHRLATCAPLRMGLLAAACTCMHPSHNLLQTQEEHTGLLPQLEVRDDVSRQHRQVDDMLQHRVLVLA